MISPNQVARLSRALPFWVSLLLVPLMVFVAMTGGHSIWLVVIFTWWLFAIVDQIVGLDRENADLATPEDHLFWYRLITLIWPPIQFALLVWLLIYVPDAPHLSSVEQVAIFATFGVITGMIGINYSHELMHQKSALERGLADFLLAMVAYGHFRSEHLLVHHTYVATPNDPVTARYNEGFHRFFPRVLWQCLRSSLKAEASRLRKIGRSPWDLRNPFWRYAALLAALLAMAFGLAGGWGIVLFAMQAFVAVVHLEVTNYIEHYGLVRKILPNGKYEPVRPHHSWNAAHRATNWLLINLQRHSDHHYKPDRRFPLLQNHEDGSAPQLPYGYAMMGLTALVPPIWRRMMNPRVRAWRKTYYPEITHWPKYGGPQAPQ